MPFTRGRSSVVRLLNAFKKTLEEGGSSTNLYRSY